MKIFVKVRNFISYIYAFKIYKMKKEFRKGIELDMRNMGENEGIGRRYDSQINKVHP